MNRLLLNIATIVACGIGAECRAADPPAAGADGDWPMFRGDRSLRGLAAGSIGKDFTLKWSFPTKSSVLASPVMAKGIVVCGTMDGPVYGIDFASGTQKWKVDAGAAVEGAATIVLAGDLGGEAKQDLAFFGTSDGVLFALDLATGAERWRYKTSDADPPPPPGADAPAGGGGGAPIRGAPNWFVDPGDHRTLLLIGSHDNRVHCVDALSGKGRWTYSTGSFIYGSPAVSDAVAVVGGCDACVHVISLKDGQAERRIPIGSPIAASAAIVGGRVFVGHHDGAVVCVDTATGEMVWSYGDHREPFLSVPAVGERLVVVGGRDQQVHAIDRAKGEKAWTFAAQGSVDGSPVICGDKVVVGSDDGRIHLLDLANGKELWSFETGGRIAGSAAICRGRILVGSEDGTIYAFAPPEGATNGK